MTGKKVYVAGSSKELSRCRGFIAEVEALGYSITENWVAEVDANQGVANTGLTPEIRERAAKACARGVDNADIVIVLVPSKDAPSIGCWVELGIALTLSQSEAKEIIYVGSVERSVFSALVSRVLDTDAEALNHLSIVAKG